VKPTITRAGNRIVSIKFQGTWPNQWKQYQWILDEMPNDEAKAEWLRSPLQLQRESTPFGEFVTVRRAS